MEIYQADGRKEGENESKNNQNQTFEEEKSKFKMIVNSEREAVKEAKAIEPRSNDRELPLEWIELINIDVFFI